MLSVNKKKLKKIGLNERKKIDGIKRVTANILKNVNTYRKFWSERVRVVKQQREKCMEIASDGV